MNLRALKKPLVKVFAFGVVSSIGLATLADTESDYAKAKSYISSINLSQQATDSVKNVVVSSEGSAKEQSYYDSPSAMEEAGAASLSDSSSVSYEVEAASAGRESSGSEESALAAMTDGIVHSKAIENNPEEVITDPIFCEDGSCAQVDQEQNDEFSTTITQLSAVNEAGEEAKGSISPRLFTGSAAHCRDELLGAFNCCSNSGWANGLFHCNTEENNIGKAKEDGYRLVYLGRYCSHKTWLGVCTEHKQGYCVFTTKLAYDLQVKGAYRQIHKRFGSAEHPSCRGLSVSQISQLDLDKIDFSNIESDITSKVTLPNASESTAELEVKITALIAGGVSYD